MLDTSFQSAVRQNQSFLARSEKRAIQLLIVKIPEWVTPLGLTGVGVFGALLVAFGLIAANWSNFWIAVVIPGLALNWFGDSLDGSLARHRRIERPRYGFLVDHASDLICNVIMIGAFGLSPYLTMVSALIVLSMYLLFASYTYVLVSVERVHHMSYGGMGATEFRILMGVWAMIAAVEGPAMFAPVVGVFSAVDIVIGTLPCGALVLFVNNLVVDSRRIAREEGLPADKAFIPATATGKQAEVIPLSRAAKRPTR